MGRAKLGKGKLAELARPEVLNQILSRCDPIGRRVGHKRFRETWEKTSPVSTEIESLLEFWADRGIVSRQWQLPRCEACLGTFWETELKISRPIRCPGCGTRLRLPASIQLGYTLHQLVRHAIDQGIMTVALTGRFLRSLTSDGFLWLPSVKFEWNGKDGDLDLIACCDGHLVVAECKSLGEASPEAGVWDRVLDQFQVTIGAAEAVHADVVALAALAKSFPEEFQRKAEEMIGSSTRLLLIDGNDLEKGYRPLTVPGSTLMSRLRIDQLVPDSMPEPPPVQPSEPRFLRTPFYTFPF